MIEKNQMYYDKRLKKLEDLVKRIAVIDPLTELRQKLIDKCFSKLNEAEKDKLRKYLINLRKNYITENENKIKQDEFNELVEVGLLRLSDEELEPFTILFERNKSD